MSDPRNLFRLLLSKLDVDFICDIGSCNGADSLYFRKILPDAVILAFEANPVNYEAMRSDEKLKKNRIEVFPFAISNYNGKVEFNIYHGNTKGLSSLYERLHRDGCELERKVNVEAHRIDSFILNGNRKIGKAALWIDVEGTGYEVLEGMENIKDLVCLVNIEVEMKEIFSGQKTKDDIVKLMNSYNFTEIGLQYHNKKRISGDIIFLNNRFPVSPAALSYLKFKIFLFKIIQPIVPKLKKLLNPARYEKLKDSYINHFIKR